MRAGSLSFEIADEHNLDFWAKTETEKHFEKHFWFIEKSQSYNSYI